MRDLLEMVMLGLVAATAGILSISWAWHEAMDWWDRRRDRPRATPGDE